jgi:hypothetical protein
MSPGRTISDELMGRFEKLLIGKGMITCLLGGYMGLDLNVKREICVQYYTSERGKRKYLIKKVDLEEMRNKLAKKDAAELAALMHDNSKPVRAAVASLILAEAFEGV